METHVPPAPGGYASLAPYLRVKDAVQAIAFYVDGLAARERFHLMMPDGRVGHAELQLGDSVLMLPDEFPEMSITGPATLGSTTVTLHLYVEDVDRTFAQAVAAGAEVIMPVRDEFYGDRVCKLRDPFGHEWLIATRVETVSVAEMQERLNALGG